MKCSKRLSVRGIPGSPIRRSQHLGGEVGVLGLCRVRKAVLCLQELLCEFISKRTYLLLRSLAHARGEFHRDRCFSQALSGGRSTPDCGSGRQGSPTVCPWVSPLCPCGALVQRVAGPTMRPSRWLSLWSELTDGSPRGLLEAGETAWGTEPLVSRS